MADVVVPTSTSALTIARPGPRFSAQLGLQLSAGPSATAPSVSAATATAVSAIGAALDSVHLGASSPCGGRTGRTKMAEQPFVAIRPATRRT